MILRVVFNKKDYLKYIGHLDLMRLFHRSFNRAQIPIKYSEGFNPHPRFSIASPLSLGIESEEEYMDIHTEYIEVEEFMDKMNKILPKDIRILRAEYVKREEEAIASIISWGYYEIEILTNRNYNDDELNQMFSKWLSNEEILITRLRKKGRKRIEREDNIRDMIGNIIIKDIKDGKINIHVLLRTGNNGNLKATDFLEVLNRDTALEVDLESARIKRLSLYADDNNNIYKPL